jgi:hypothetical protein
MQILIKYSFQYRQNRKPDKQVFHNDILLPLSVLRNANGIFIVC